MIDTEGVMDDDIRVQQIEALRMADEYLKKLIPSIEEVITELDGEMKEDSVDYLEQIVEGFNFMIETFNVTMDLINEERVIIDKDDINRAVLNLSDALLSNNYKQAATI
ncbi:MAG TPA: hypothetical protein PLU43_01960, partial [Lachnospiraceae bacterium]|nr:hypothetical protein [Lachnospiraceae bacterium]